MSTRGRALIAGVVALACLGIGLGTAPSAQAAQPSSTGCIANAELKVGDIGSSVICLQYALGMLGLSQMPISGVYDDATANLVTWFQATHPPLRVDGRAGPQTLTAMGIYSGQIAGVAVIDAVACAADATIRPGETSQSVRCMQDALHELGLFDGASTGTSDAATIAALKRFQALTPPLDVDGWGGPRTLAALGIWSGRTGIVSSDGTVSFPIIATPSGGGGRGGSGVVGNAPAGPWPAPIQPEKNWTLSIDGIPNYGNRVPCTRPEADTIAYQFGRDGADVATQQWAVYIASREGGCHYDAVNQNAATQDDSHCTFQLNVLSGAFGPTGELGRHGWTAENVKASLDNCADAASDLWVYCGRGPWQPPYSCRPPWKDMATAVKVPATPINPTATTPTTTTTTTTPTTTAPTTTEPPAPNTTVPADALTSVTVANPNPNPEG